jgi:Xaa-Pro aminopeptidase
MEVGIENLTPGKPEKEIAAQIEFEMLKKGADEKSFNTIIASGPNSWFPHAGATDRKLEEGDIVTIDMGASYEGYHADLTLTVFVG